MSDTEEYTVQIPTRPSDSLRMNIKIDFGDANLIEIFKNEVLLEFQKAVQCLQQCVQQRAMEDIFRRVKRRILKYQRHLGLDYSLEQIEVMNHHEKFGLLRWSFLQFYGNLYDDETVGSVCAVQIGKYLIHEYLKKDEVIHDLDELAESDWLEDFFEDYQVSVLNAIKFPQD